MAGGEVDDDGQRLQDQEARADHAADLAGGDQAALLGIVPAGVDQAEGVIRLQLGIMSEHGAADEAEDAQHQDTLFLAHGILCLCVFRHEIWEKVAAGGEKLHQF